MADYFDRFGGSVRERRFVCLLGTLQHGQQRPDQLLQSFADPHGGRIAFLLTGEWLILERARNTK